MKIRMNRMKMKNVWNRTQEKMKLAKKQAQAGFTLIEMMIVLAVIALVMGFVGTNVIRRYNESQVTATKIQMKQLLVILDDFRRLCNFYPSTEQGLDALVTAPTGGRTCKNYEPGGFVKKVPTDAWGNPFIYTFDGNKPVLKSLGADGKEGGEGFDKDITSNDLD